jgi:hypothetical protein
MHVQTAKATCCVQDMGVAGRVLVRTHTCRQQQQQQAAMLDACADCRSNMLCEEAQLAFERHAMLLMVLVEKFSCTAC